MKKEQNLYEPAVNFREQRPQMQINDITNNPLYEKAFFSGEDKSQTEYAQNTTTWD